MAFKLKFRPGKIATFCACLLPFAWLVWRTVNNDLGADPVNEITHFTGDWTLRFLLITLAVTPLRRLTHQYWTVQYRRMLGLFAFFYGCVHFLTWVVFDKVFGQLALDNLSAGSVLHEMALDIAKRPYITMGMLALTLMLPLAITSTRGWIRRLGKRWQRLHRLIYISAVAGVVHYWWLVKKDIRPPALYAGLLALLLGYRVVTWLTTRKAKAPVAARPATAD